MPNKKKETESAYPRLDLLRDPQYANQSTGENVQVDRNGRRWGDRRRNNVSEQRGTILLFLGE